MLLNKKSYFMFPFLNQCSYLFPNSYIYFSNIYPFPKSYFYSYLYPNYISMEYIKNISTSFSKPPNPPPFKYIIIAIGFGISYMLIKRKRKSLL